MRFERIQQVRFSIHIDPRNSYPSAQQERTNLTLRLVAAEVRRLAEKYGDKIGNYLTGTLANFISITHSHGEISIKVCAPRDIRSLDRFLESYSRGFDSAKLLTEPTRDAVRITLSDVTVQEYLKQEARKGTPLQEIKNSLQERFGIELTDRGICAIMQRLSCLNLWVRTKGARTDIPRPKPTERAPPVQSRRRSGNSLSSHASEIVAHITAANANGGCTRESVVKFIERRFGIKTTEANLSTMLSVLRKTDPSIPYIGG